MVIDTGILGRSQAQRTTHPCCILSVLFSILVPIITAILFPAVAPHDHVAQRAVIPAPPAESHTFTRRPLSSLGERVVRPPLSCHRLNMRYHPICRSR